MSGPESKTHWSVRVLALLNILFTVWFWKMALIILNPDTSRGVRLLGAFAFVWLNLWMFLLPLFIVIGIGTSFRQKIISWKDSLEFNIDLVLALVSSIVWALQPYTFATL